MKIVYYIQSALRDQSGYSPHSYYNSEELAKKQLKDNIAFGSYTRWYIGNIQVLDEEDIG